MIQETFHLILLLSTKEAAGPGLEPGTARSKVWCATIAPAGNRSKSTETGEDFEETFCAGRLGSERGKACFFADGVEGLAAELDGFVQRGGSESEVAHFSARAGLGFSVEVEGSTGEGEERSPIGFTMVPKITEEVEHGGGGGGRDMAEGKAADGAELLFKLAGGASFGG